MWHGPSVCEAVGDLTATHAASYPVQHAHSVWELTLHIAAWAEIVRARLCGTPWRTPSDVEDFPLPDATGGVEAWMAAQQRAIVAYESLATEVMSRPAASLDDLVIHQTYTAVEMLHGVVEHGVYHAGQIILLRRIIQADARRQPPNVGVTSRLWNRNA